MSPTLRWLAWRDFEPDTLYALMRLRSAVFVVEQACVFQDMDGLDPRCEHLLAGAEPGEVLGALRLLPPGLERRHGAAPAPTGPALGRLVTALQVRGTGLGRRLMTEGIARCGRDYPGQAIRLSAQRRLQHFYAAFGFEPLGEPYDEDGILHVEMRRGGAR